jgi:hypothetical protein
LKKEEREMKKLLLLCAIVLLFGVYLCSCSEDLDTLGQPHYHFAEVGTKNFITETTINVGDSVSLDLYLSNVPAAQNAGGAWIDFSGSTGNISYVSGGRCLAGGAEGCTGPWQDNAGVFINEAGGPGTVYYVVANLAGATPDVDGDLIVGTLTLQYTSAGDATVNLTTIPSVSTWSPINDSDVVPGSLLIQQVGGEPVCGDGTVESGEDCDPPGGCCAADCTYEPGETFCGDPTETPCDAADTCDGEGNCQPNTIPDGTPCLDDTDTTCDGADSCLNGICRDNLAPEGTPCDDGVFCNGAETCDGLGTCDPGTPRSCGDGVACTVDMCDTGLDACVNTPDDANCPDDGVFCNGDEFCDAELDCSSTGDPCVPPDVCREVSGICELPADCLIDEDCDDDGIGCTNEICDEGTCLSIPIDANCPDDGVFCNGTEFCDAELDCSSTGDPCDESENCDEENDECVLENLPPDCSTASADPSELWSPNHKYVDIAIIDVTDPDGDPVMITIDAITQDEEVNALGIGDGNTSPDGKGVGTDTASIRSERQGSGNGRVYEISFTAEDGNGAACSGAVQVCTPHDQRPGHACIDDGQNYDSTDRTMIRQKSR